MSVETGKSVPNNVESVQKGITLKVSLAAAPKASRSSETVIESAVEEVTWNH